ncbi:MAG TPA: hypothetical protein VF973_02435 [Myxococcales bacterium]
MLETKIAWFSKIDTRDDALEVVKVASYAFFFLAALQLVLYLVLKSAGAFLDAAIMVAGAVAVLRLHSRAAAAVLFAISCAEALVTLANMLGAHLGVGRNVILAGLMVWVAVRAIQATWALERMPDEDEDDEELRSVAPRH